jgi:hypothetical protein
MLSISSSSNVSSASSPLRSRADAQKPHKPERPKFEQGSAKIIVYLPIDTHQPLCQHAEAKGRKLSRLARELLLADLSVTIGLDEAMRREFAARVAARPLR